MKVDTEAEDVVIAHEGVVEGDVGLDVVGWAGLMVRISCGS